ncbi:transposase [Hydrotalea sp. AMD]|uniref:IS66 family transposase n=1 Tax=Hydrotalea sp. AMD TaxID=2501297 RepID=UPI00257E033D|nr:transposase [Hydrotalea sp. AMD]
MQTHCQSPTSQHADQSFVKSLQSQPNEKLVLKNSPTLQKSKPPNSTIGNWVTAGAAFLKPLYEAPKQLVLAGGYLHANETILKVLDSDKKNATYQGYYWVYQCNANKLLLFLITERAGAGKGLKAF